MSQTVADTLVGVLEEIGVKYIFGLIGDSLNPLADSVRRSGIEWVGVRHEEGAALAAAGQAKLTGRLAVCAGTTGPGSTHLVAGLHEAARDHAPVLARRWHQHADVRVSNRGAPRVSFLLFGLQSREWGWIPGPFTGSVVETKPKVDRHRGAEPRCRSKYERNSDGYLNRIYERPEHGDVRQNEVSHQIALQLRRGILDHHLHPVDQSPVVVGRYLPKRRLPPHRAELLIEMANRGTERRRQ
jgi:hypothetical protein